MSNIVWSADKGWHDGEPVKLILDTNGRIIAVPVRTQPVPIPSQS